MVSPPMETFELLCRNFEQAGLQWKKLNSQASSLPLVLRAEAKNSSELLQISLKKNNAVAIGY